jgi:hypothetical protein
MQYKTNCLHLTTDLAANVTHILCVFSVNVHLAETKVWEHEHSWRKLRGLVIVLECLVIITLQATETAGHYNMFRLNSHTISSHIYHFCSSTRQVHKVSFPLVPQLANHILREATAHT